MPVDLATLEAPENLPLQGSPLLQQAIENLIDNAVKFNPRAGRIRVQVEGRADKARVTVLDEGPGIPADEHDRLFERFQQGDDGPLGSRLGLAIVHRLVNLHGGDIEVRDDAEEGTRIEIRLPCGSATTPTPPPARTERSGVTARLREVIG
jgi:signal transduction histidine kinase